MSFTQSSSPGSGGVPLPLPPLSPTSSTESGGVSVPASPTESVTPSSNALPQPTNATALPVGFPSLAARESLIADFLTDRSLDHIQAHPQWLAPGSTTPGETYEGFVRRVVETVNDTLIATGPPFPSPEDYEDILSGAIAESALPLANRNRRSPVIDIHEARALNRGLSPDAALAEALLKWGEYLRAMNAHTTIAAHQQQQAALIPPPPVVHYEEPRQRAVTAAEAADVECICGICLESIGKEGGSVTVLPCVGHDLHFYHGECIGFWMEGREAGKRCPIGCLQSVRDEAS